MRYLSEIFWTLSWNVCILNPNNSEFLIWLSFCQLAYFLNEIMSIQGYLQLWIKYISEFFWRHFRYVCRPIPNNSEFLVCLSVCQLALFLTEIRLIWGYHQFWMRYRSEFFWKHSQDISGLFPNYSLFFVYLSVCMPVFIFLPIGRLWGSTSETFGLVRLLIMYVFMEKIA